MAPHRAQLRPIAAELQPNCSRSGGDPMAPHRAQLRPVAAELQPNCSRSGGDPYGAPPRPIVSKTQPLQPSRSPPSSPYVPIVKPTDRLAAPSHPLGRRRTTRSG